MKKIKFNMKTRTQSFPIGESFISVKVLQNLFKFARNKTFKKQFPFQKLQKFHE